MFKPLPPSRDEQRLYRQERTHQHHRHAQMPLPEESRSSNALEVKKKTEENIVRTRRERLLLDAIKKHAAEIATQRDEEKMYLSCAFNPLNSSTSIPSDSSQQWCAMMRQVLLRSCEKPDEEISEKSFQEGDDHLVAPVIPIRLIGVNNSVAGPHHQARRIRSVPTSSSISTSISIASALRCSTEDKDEDEVDHGDEDEDYDGSASTSALDAGTIATIAKRARCQEALWFLRYVMRTRRAHREGAGEVASAAAAAASAAAGHGWKWVEDNCRCVFDLLASVPAIASLDLIFKRNLLWMLGVVSWRKGQAVFRQGDVQETLWLILDGRIGLSSTSKRGVVLRAGIANPGQVMGSLLPERRLATATCLEKSTLLRVDGATFRRVLEDYESRRAIARKTFLGSVSLFKGLGERDLDHLASAFQLMTVEAGEVLCREGNRVDFLYLIKRGSIRLLKAFVPHSQTGQQQQENELAQRAEKEVYHFDVGVAGPREFIGEGGFDAGAIAAAGASRVEGGGREEELGVELEGGVRGSGPGVAARSGASVGDRGSSYSHTHKYSSLGGKYLVSAVAKWSADVFAAKVSDLLPMQTAAIKACWIEGREVHQMKKREWNAASLAERLQEQAHWESTKRAIVLDSVRTGVLEKRMMSATNRARRDESE